ncbi:MAG: hypothetical protein VX527_04520 [Planctomycetota bacterium]|nr:hypothetical protein [Planctomycetota bacterium]
MEISGPYPFRAAAAYQPGRGVQQPGQVRINAIRPTEATPTVGPVSSNPIDRLVAARVPMAMEFDTQAMTPVRKSDAYQLYTRDADRIEAATGVHRGRIVDLKG